MDKRLQVLRDVEPSFKDNDTLVLRVREGKGEVFVHAECPVSLVYDREGKLLRVVILLPDWILKRGVET